jgi:hypothetical protein
MLTHEIFHQRTPLGALEVAVTRHEIAIASHFNVPYEGADPLVQQAFPDGFAPSYGSGLAFKGVAADGALAFYCLTDRGPNGDGPQVPALAGGGVSESKLFPAPGFTPSIGIVHVGAQSAALMSSVPIRISATLMASGLPLPPGTLGNSAEIPLHDSLRFEAGGKALFHAGGIDSEALAFDRRRGVLWVTDEYGPFLLKIAPDSGAVLARYAPGSGLPPILGKRRANRGMEGMTHDPATDSIHAFLQSPLSDGVAPYALTGKEEKIERYASFLRWIAFDPDSGSTLRMMAYPLAAADYAHGRTGNAKLGDMVALGGGKFVVIEQGEGSEGRMFNKLMLVDTANATDIGAAAFHPDSADLERSSMLGQAVGTADWAAVTPLRKVELLDLNAIGWLAEKAEGLALVDAHTLAMTNDNDFGMKTRVFDAAGAERAHADVTGFEVDAAGALIKGAAATDRVRVARGEAHERPLSLWLLRFREPLASYDGR